MNTDVMITCAITGDDTKVTKSPHCAVTPTEIAAAAIDAANAGAAIVHIHVRDPETGAFSMETKHYRAVVKAIRESGTDVIVNLTCGMGGYIAVGDNGLKDTPAPGSDFCSQEDRMRHVIDLCEEGLYRPDICTLDCGSLNFGDGNRAYVSTPNYLRKGTAICKDLGVKPEFEIFDTGNLWFVRQMIKEGLVLPPPLIQLCMGIPWGMPADTGHLLAMVNTMPIMKPSSMAARLISPPRATMPRTSSNAPIPSPANNDRARYSSGERATSALLARRMPAAVAVARSTRTPNSPIPRRRSSSANSRA